MASGRTLQAVDTSQTDAMRYYVKQYSTGTDKTLISQRNFVSLITIANNRKTLIVKSQVFKRNLQTKGV